MDFKQYSDAIENCNKSTDSTSDKNYIHNTNELKEIMEDLLNYEKHFYKTQKKSKFDISKYFCKLYPLLIPSTNLNNFMLYRYDDEDKPTNIDSVGIFYTKYNIRPYYVKISDIIDRFIIVNENFNITTILDKISFTINKLYYLRHTTLFIMLSQYLCNIYIISSIPYKFDNVMLFDRLFDIIDVKIPKYYISNYIYIYISEIISKTLDDKFINKEIDIFKKIIDNLYKLNYEHDIVKTSEYLFNYKNEFNINNKEKQVYFCDILLNYILYDLNLLETIEYKNKFTFLQTYAFNFRSLDDCLNDK